MADVQHCGCARKKPLDTAGLFMLEYRRRIWMNSSWKLTWMTNGLNISGLMPTEQRRTASTGRCLRIEG
jgi:hypothetical protein